MDFNLLFHLKISEMFILYFSLLRYLCLQQALWILYTEEQGVFRENL